MHRARILSVVFIVMVGAVGWSGGRVRAVEPGGGDRRVAPDEAGLPYPVVDTGQADCYDTANVVNPPGPGEAFWGQDAQYSGWQPSYVVSGDGLTVLDLVTGLTWIQSPDTDGDGDIDAADKKSWVELPSFVAAANAAGFGGFDDWRVPTVKELYSLIDFRGTDPAPDMTNPTHLTPFLDTDVFAFGYGDLAAGERLIDAQYWSSTDYVATTMNGDATVFGVNFADGRIKGYPRDVGPGGTATRYVRLVRGNPVYGVNDLVDNGDGTVTDLATGLVWQQSDSGAGMSWEEALAYAEDLELAGYDDWRLPNAKELQSIVDYSRSPDTTGSAAIDPVFQVTEISNENLEVDDPAYWTGTTHASAAVSAPGRAAVYIAFGRGMGYMFSAWLDVHGAGCQRSDPKEGDLDDYTYVPYGHYQGSAPQGDAIRIFNFVRCVRGAGGDPALIFDDGFESGDPTAWAVSKQ
ncbi:MAG: DUF1566 domain-containing protein [Candidatus Sulfomarinibacteraceae bacterium]